MRRTIIIALSLLLTFTGFAQEETRIVDSLLHVLPTQEGREKVLTMIELTWEFFDISYDDCLNWGEKSIKEAQNQGLADLEAKANYVLGIQYAYHGDLDLAKEYLQNSFDQFTALGDTKNAFEALWNIATYELSYGSIDTSYQVYEKALPLAEQLNDSSACAYVVSNMALIWYKRDEKRLAYEYYEKAKRWFKALGDELRVARMELNMAAIRMEQGKAEEARRIYWRILPKFEAFGDNHFLFLACKNMGTIYENDFIDYDSAMFYLEKAIATANNPMLYRENDVFLNNEKSGALVEMGNIFVRQERFSEAVAKYEDALELAENSGYLYGQMEACVCLGKVYSQLGQAQKSMGYFGRYFELERASSLTKLRPSFRKALCMDYARLGMMKELEAELTDLEEYSAALTRENQDVFEQCQNLQNTVYDLLSQHESQNLQIETLQTQRNHYRLVFFGLLSIVLFVVVLLIARKIVQKKWAKM